MCRALKSFFVLFILSGISGSLLVSCVQRSAEGMIVMTVAANEQQLNFDVTDKAGFFEETKILMIDPVHPESEPISLSEDFYAACSPDISFDAKKMVFAGKKNQNDIWQLYEMELTSLQYKQLTNSTENSTSPAYLPGDRIIYSKEIFILAEEKSQALFVIKSDRSKEEQITFSPGSYTGSSVLHDGRVISMNRSLHSELNKYNLMVMRPDGTKEMLFYQSNDKSQLVSKGRETEEGEIFLLEKNDDDTRKLISISYNNPLKSRKLISENAEDDFIGISSLNNGHLLACYRTSKEDTYSLFELDASNMKFVKSIFQDPLYTAIEAVAVEQHRVPKKIPSEVNTKEQTGLLLCQDINYIGFHENTLQTDALKAVKVEILGLESSLGIVDAEKDGSVYLKIKADMPFQLQTLNEEGEIVKGPSSWINLRPNERRACVGCHQGNEIVPENRQPLSVLKEPIPIPSLPKLLAERE